MQPVGAAPPAARHATRTGHFAAPSTVISCASVSSQDFVDAVLSKTQRKTPTVVHPGYAIARIRQFYMRKVKFTQANFEEKLDGILMQFPKLDVSVALTPHCHHAACRSIHPSPGAAPHTRRGPHGEWRFERSQDIHPFYADLMNVLYDRDHYKLALGHCNTARSMCAIALSCLPAGHPTQHATKATRTQKSVASAKADEDHNYLNICYLIIHESIQSRRGPLLRLPTCRPCSQAQHSRRLL